MRGLGVFASVLCLACSPSTPSEPAPRAAVDTSRWAQPTPADGWFVDVTSPSGVDFLHQNGASSERHLPEAMGAGALLWDLDEDGDLDLYFVQGGPMPKGGPAPGAFLPAEGERPVNRLYRNDGKLAFTDVTRTSGAAADPNYGMGVAAGDVDADGHVDMYLTNVGPDVLLRGDGKLFFEDRTRAAGLGDERWTTGATFLDADHDGDLDLIVTGYVLVDLAHPSWCGDRKPGWRSVCHPDHYPALADRFWRNRGDGTFEDATASAGLAGDLGKGLCAAPFDADDDGDVDLFIANDSTENALWLNRGNATFEDGTLISGTGVDAYGNTEASMGVATGDIDGDLDLDLFVTGFDDESDTLYRNLGEHVFEDATAACGLELATRLPVGFGTVLADFDQDGDLDLAIANGHIVHNIELYNDSKSYAQEALLFANDGRGHFTDVSRSGGGLTARPYVGRGLYSGDLDGDLDLDLVLTQCGRKPVILENRAARGGALMIDGLPPGARVVLTRADGSRLVREAGPAPSYLGQCAPLVHFGLASTAAVAIAVRVPGDREVEFPLDPPIASGRVRFTNSSGAFGLRR